MRREPSDCGRTTQLRSARRGGEAQASRKCDALGALAALCALLGAVLGLHDAGTPEPAPAGDPVATSLLADARGVATTSVQGTVRSAEGRGIPEAIVCASPVDQATRVLPNHCVVADAHGGYVFADMSPAAYVVTASAEGHASAVAHGGQPLRLTGYGSMIGVDVVLQPAAPVGSGLDASRRAIDRASLSGVARDAPVATRASVRASSPTHQGRAPARAGESPR